MSQVINIGDCDVIVVGDLMCDVIFLRNNIMIMMFYHVYINGLEGQK